MTFIVYCFCNIDYYVDFSFAVVLLVVLLCICTYYRSNIIIIIIGFWCGFAQTRMKPGWNVLVRYGCEVWLFSYFYRWILLCGTFLSYLSFVIQCFGLKFFALCSHILIYILFHIFKDWFGKWVLYTWFVFIVFTILKTSLSNLYVKLKYGLLLV